MIYKGMICPIDKIWILYEDNLLSLKVFPLESIKSRMNFPLHLCHANFHE